MNQFFCAVLFFFFVVARQSVTDSWYSENVSRVTRVGFHFLAEMTDMCFDQAGIAIVAKAPDMSDHDMLVPKQLSISFPGRSIYTRRARPVADYTRIGGCSFHYQYMIFF